MSHGLHSVVTAPESQGATLRSRQLSARIISFLETETRSRIRKNADHTTQPFSGGARPARTKEESNHALMPKDQRPTTHAFRPTKSHLFPYKSRKTTTVP